MRAQRDAQRDAEDAVNVARDSQYNAQRALARALRIAEDAQRAAEHLAEDAQSEVERARAHTIRTAEDALREAERVAQDAALEAQRVRARALRISMSAQTEGGKYARETRSSASCAVRDTRTSVMYRKQASAELINEGTQPKIDLLNIAVRVRETSPADATLLRTAENVQRDAQLVSMETEPVVERGAALNRDSVDVLPDADRRTGFASPYPGLQYTGKLKERWRSTLYAGIFNGKEVAVKVLRRHRIEEQSKTKLTMLLKMAKHPNVVDVLDFHELPRPAVVMRFVKGKNLKEFLRDYGPMTSKVARPFARGIADGLAHLHRNGFAHLDINPSNILVDKNNIPIIIVPGMPSALDCRRTQFQHVTTAGNGRALSSSMLKNDGLRNKKNVAWTFAPHLPSEMLAKAGRSSKEDVYSLGVLLWEILGGNHSYERPSSEHLRCVDGKVSDALGERPNISDLPADVEEDLIQLLRASWNAEHDKRPSMHVFADTLSRESTTKATGSVL